MGANRRRVQILQVLLITGGWLIFSPHLSAQDARDSARAATQATSAQTPDMRQIADAVRELQEQMKALNAQVSDLKQSNEEAHAEARQLRNELHRLNGTVVAATTSA